MRLAMRLCVFLLFIVASSFASADKVTTASVYWDPEDKVVVLKEGVLETEGDAYGYLNDTMSRTGWSVLEIRAGYGKTPETDEVTFFLAGYLEGFLSAQQMIDHYANMYPQLIHDPKILGPLQSFMTKQDLWTREQVKLNRSSDPLWKHAGFIVAQMDGLQAGVAHWAKTHGQKPLSLFAVQFLNAVGDLLDLIPALVPTSNPLRNFKLPGMGHCSALIKMLPGFENLLFAHSSWYTYAATMRIYKHWDFHITEPHTATGKLSFSSYPGFLVSMDDFYLLGSGLMMTQTTNNVFNASLFDTVTPDSLLAWQRVRLAHSLAKTGEEWAKTFSKHNSGTYNNQYMVLDRSRVKLGLSVDDGALTVVEQIPGLVEYSDQTQALRRGNDASFDPVFLRSLFHVQSFSFPPFTKGYWPSYNVPFHHKIYKLSGYEEMWDKHGEDFSYDLCSRAKIFRRDQADVKDLDSLKRIMRSNDYKKDPYSKGEPCKTICCRADLRAEKPTPAGCYDTKVTDFFMAGDFRVEAVNGPTTQDGLPPFFWDEFSSISHQGLPQLYNFTFIRMQPLLFKP
ncbi:phospholipase B-like 1 isoform X1 [Pseudoliparis swirei]|uniref:phospholipase B-like 1 isoform X1 n=1 Tax=Pseudoliparis swirei TaxID=2059687 RepID=UPI0024BE7253|nr:phospholipase B-like 1 isoform X1 [Pseudoliparis swirei]XP_056263762.1 phospholipase B-like 1 isoform X1 [Pseudoliparis swirei]XP_056263763.1 phospholipase B-like 1 isoform X1 [Pseudoliparis swirei]